jgi:hypothetical protein
MARMSEMEILWEPEAGTCSECGGGDRLIRRFSASGTVRRFCFPCWDAAQDPHVMSSQDWTDDERVTFEVRDGFPAEEPPSRAA